MVKRGIKRVRPQNVKRVKHNINWKAIVASVVLTLIAIVVWQYLKTRTNQAQLQRNLQAKQVELENKLKELDKTKGDSVELQKQLDETKKQLQAKKSSNIAYAETLPVKPVQAVQPVLGPTRGNCGDNIYKQYIYQHESGCDTNRYNSIGCYGIGQACPASKIGHCGADFACQDAWFSNYAVSKYGSWEQAYYFWLQNNWW